MKTDFNFERIEGCASGYIGILRHETYAAHIQVYEHTFYIGDRDAYRVSVNANLLKQIATIQKSYRK